MRYNDAGPGVIRGLWFSVDCLVARTLALWIA